MQVRGDGHKYYYDVPVIGFHSSGKAYTQVNNRNIFIDHSVPGDVVDLKVAKRQKGYVVGSVIQVKNPSEDRIRPFCKHAGVCGGCNWLHINYDAQLRFKKQILENALQKYEIIFPVIQNVIPSPKKSVLQEQARF